MGDRWEGWEIALTLPLPLTLTLTLTPNQVRRSLTAMEDGLASLIPRESSYTIPGFIPSEVTLTPTLTP